MDLKKVTKGFDDFGRFSQIIEEINQNTHNNQSADTYKRAFR